MRLFLFHPRRLKPAAENRFQLRRWEARPRALCAEFLWMREFLSFLPLHTRKEQIA